MTIKIYIKISYLNITLYNNTFDIIYFVKCVIVINVHKCQVESS